MNLLNTVMSRRSYPISPWLEMFETEIRTQEDMQLWHTIKPFDYVTALVETSCGKIALVKQLRDHVAKEIGAAHVATCPSVFSGSLAMVRDLLFN